MRCPECAVSFIDEDIKGFMCAECGKVVSHMLDGDELK